MITPPLRKRISTPLLIKGFFVVFDWLSYVIEIFHIVLSVPFEIILSLTNEVLKSLASTFLNDALIE